MMITGPHKSKRGGGLTCRPDREVTWAYVGSVSGALGGRHSLLVPNGGAGNNGWPMVGPLSSACIGADVAAAAFAPLVPTGLSTAVEPGGRPLRGGCATSTSPGATWATFSQSMEILSVLVPTWTSNHLPALAMTL